MDHSNAQAQIETRYELRYIHLAHAGRGYAFPCDEQGHVDIDRLSAKGRIHYLYARAVVGLELSFPRVVRADLEWLAAS